MRHEGEPSVEEILESIKKVIARDNRETLQADRRRRENAGILFEPVAEPDAEEPLDQLEEATADSRYFQATGNDEDQSDDVGAYAEGAYATASGEAANAFGQGASAYGSGAYADGQYSTASGYNATAMADSATAVGGSLYYEDPDTGEVLLDQTTTASEVGASALGAGAQANGAFSTATGAAANAEGLQSSASGYSSAATGDYTTANGSFSSAGGIAASALGYGAEAAGDYATAVGVAATAGGMGSVAVGEFSEATGDESVAVGGTTLFGLIPAQASGTGATAVGAGAWATADYGTAIGWNSWADAAGATAVGESAFAVAADSLALGAGAEASADNAVALGQGSIADQANTVAVGSEGSERRITHVAAGRIAAGSSDAVTGGQVHGALDSIAQVIGGGSEVTAFGTVSAPAFMIQGGTYFSVGDALGAVDAEISLLGSRVDALEGAAFVLTPLERLVYDEKAVAKVLLKDDGEGVNTLRELRAQLAAVTDWTTDSLHTFVETFAESHSLGMGKVAQPLRVALTGSTVSPPIDATLAILGKPEALARIDRCLESAVSAAPR